ncbi:LOW QUALITY PROTEIN: uncharacterized protein LOC109848345 [Asparagus officinalis]|uniref:LOW QUALITY PROTEIN: uncharacterized protein LOC109848345 n=1 Tax=Asparagus officinalis TaxID=4686 RepID=UPI00098DEA79|nr:LOW QUALITY PROTEIN: uncharacterized protein LOC109848345 [Asparagus officinalis]
MKALVTGATGYLGSNLCRLSLAEGHPSGALVRGTSDLTSSHPSNSSPASFELAYGDVTRPPLPRRRCSGCHVIFTTAALVEAWLPDPSRFFSVNVGGLKNVLEAFKATDSVEKIVYTSSFFALGSTDGYVADESQVHHGKVFCTEYEKSKVIADTVAMRAASEGIPIILLYPGVIYGAGKLTAGNIVSRIMIERLNGRLPGYIGYGKDRESFSHVEDVVEGHIAAMQKGRMGERYLLTGENASFKDVFDIAAVITKTRRPSFHLPLWVIEVYGWISVFFARITGKLPLISYPTVRVLRHQWAYSCEKARKELGYNPRSLKEGLEEMLPWLKSLGLINY